LSESDWGDDSISAISASATTLTTGSTYSESNDEDEYGGDDGEYDSFGGKLEGEFDDDDEDAGYDGQLELDGRGRLAARAGSSHHTATPRVALEQVQAGSPLHGTNALLDTAQPQRPRVRHRRDTSGWQRDGRSRGNAGFIVRYRAQRPSCGLQWREQFPNYGRSVAKYSILVVSSVTTAACSLEALQKSGRGHSAIHKFTKRAVCKVCFTTEIILRYQAAKLILNWWTCVGMVRGLVFVCCSVL
jgi:hypothetical protein